MRPPTYWFTIHLRIDLSKSFSNHCWAYCTPYLWTNKSFFGTAPFQYLQTKIQKWNDWPRGHDCRLTHYIPYPSNLPSYKHHSYRLPCCAYVWLTINCNALLSYINLWLLMLPGICIRNYREWNLEYLILVDWKVCLLVPD